MRTKRTGVRATSLRRGRHHGARVRGPRGLQHQPHEPHRRAGRGPADGHVQVPKDVDQVSLDVEHGSEQLLHVQQSIGAGQLLLPASFPIAATGDAVPLQIHAVARTSPGSRRSRATPATPVPVGYVGELVLALNYFLCVGMVSGDGGSTCTLRAARRAWSGTCISHRWCRRAASHPTHLTTRERTPALRRAFDTLDCFASATPASLDTSTCSVAAPASTGSLNVALQLAPPGSQGICSATACWVPIPEGGGGGWTLANGRVVLPAGGLHGAHERRVVHHRGDDRVPDRRGTGERAVRPLDVATAAAEHRRSGVHRAVIHPGDVATAASPDAHVRQRHVERLVVVPGARGVCAPDASQACGDAGTQQCGGELPVGRLPGPARARRRRPAATAARRPARARARAGATGPPAATRACALP